MSHISELKRTKRGKQVQQCFPTVSEGLQCCLGEWTRMKSLQQEKISISRLGDKMRNEETNTTWICCRPCARVCSRCKYQLMFMINRQKKASSGLGVWEDVSNVRVDLLALNRPLIRMFQRMKHQHEEISISKIAAVVCVSISCQ